ncbi:pentapeptide repeat-containing protein [Helicobacter sp.]|uniref:pentapeptide repeat-containing protein n=1 Tax=Helicobacter sp. TaxID=218 RepID=UPI0025898E3F|nr:pentapeptide repeat-containing protein [Helicobacter sp.]MCI7046658.1 pentapeptide repeat-containing protein [Helicobacter sp.]
MEYDKQLKEYGILATNAKLDIKDNVLFIESTEIEEINLKTLQEKKTRELIIKNSKINNLLFTQINNIKLNFECCTFKNQVIAREYNFNNTIAFIECIFESIVDFSKTTFQCEVDFFASTFKDETNFTEARFLVKQRDNNKIAKNNFIKSTFEKDVSFDDVEFHTKVYFVISHFKAQASFIRTKFLAKQDDNGIIENGFAQIIFKGNAYFNDAKFQAKVSFAMSHFEAQANFTETKFLAKQDNGRIIENNFSEVIFEKSAYFNDSVFENFADFNKCDFREIANFYGVTFKKTPNFSQTIFNGSVNLVNANLKFNFKDLQTTINQKYDFYKKSIKITADAIITKSQNKSLDKFANDFRDSFRVFKNALIKDNNLLDASNFHKYELYSKEIELDSKETKTIKDKIEKWQLWFYLNLCDHHTDILKSFHSLMLVIGLFGLMGLGVIAGFDYCLGYKPILSHLYMVKEIYDAHIHSFIKTHTLCTIAFNFFILAFYLLGILVYLISVKSLRRLFIVVSYAVVICILLISPKILIPAMGIFTDKRALLDPLSTLGGIYTIVFGFVLFSFIKTIRKNSIVPN